MKISHMVVTAALFALTSTANADESSSPLDLMVVSKMTGVCGVLQQMVAFQASTKMPGGSEFIARFWSTELARLGKSQAQFVKECSDSIAIYTKYYDAFEQMKTTK